jgi:lipopolysaccharide/colanic/teichoic acid biosynthesis glycosyltransferase
MALLVGAESRGPILFRQPRVGRHGRLFSILKLRTMVADASVENWDMPELNIHESLGDSRMWKAFRDPRVTRAGALARALKIDELPQLVNVLRGEMSLVGPRPLTVDEDRWVEGAAVRRREVRPGMTGAWQVLGGNAVPMGTMLWLDALYVEKKSPVVDIRIALRTPGAIEDSLASWRAGGTG